MPWTCCQLPVDVWFARLAVKTCFHPSQVSHYARSTIHIVVMNAIFIRLANSVALGLYANVAQLMELPLTYFVTGEFYDLFVVAELGEL